MSLPDTRASLILRLPDARDVEAWDEFVAIYEPLIYRVARRKGMQHADAQELVQEVLLSVSRAVENWEPDPERGRFRDWLFRIARNLIVNHLTRRKYRSIGSGDSRVARLLHSQPARPDVEESVLLDIEYRREVFFRAADVVRSAVKDKTWQAFHMTSVDGVPASRAAERLGMTVGGVYIARSRVMARLRDEVQRMAADSQRRV